MFAEVSPQPDLVITSFTGPSTGVIGGLIPISVSIENQGVTTNTSFRLGFYYSTDSVITTGDAFSGWLCNFPSGLAGGASTGCAGSIGVPSGLSPGTYYLGAIADDLLAVGESNETNNTRAADTGAVTLQSPSGVFLSGFESGTLPPWMAFGGGAAAVTGGAARSGSFGLEVSGGSGLSVFRDVAGLTPGQTYEVTAHVRSSPGSAAAFLWLHDTTGGNLSVFQPAPGAATYQPIKLQYRANATGAVRIHLDFVGGAGKVEWDDISVAERNSEEYGFESGGLAPWVTFGGGAAAVTGGAARSGSFGLEVSGGSGLSVFTDLTWLTPGQTYEVTAYVRRSPGSAAAFLWLHDTTGGGTCRSSCRRRPRVASSG